MRSDRLPRYVQVQACPSTIHRSPEPVCWCSSAMGRNHVAWRSSPGCTARSSTVSLARGLQDADAADLMQDVMRSISTCDRPIGVRSQSGSFRAGCSRSPATRSTIFFRQAAFRPQGSGDTTTNQLLDSATRPERRAAPGSGRYHLRLASVDGPGEMSSGQHLADLLAHRGRGSWGPEAAESRPLAGAIYVAKAACSLALKKKSRSMRRQEEN